MNSKSLEPKRRHDDTINIRPDGNTRKDTILSCADMSPLLGCCNTPRNSEPSPLSNPDDLLNWCFDVNTRT